MSTISTPALDSSSSPVVPQDSSAGQAGDPGQPVLTLLNGQLPRGFVPMTVSSPSQPPPPQMAPTFSYSTPSAPNVAVASPRMSPRTDPRALYGVPVPDASSSSGRLSSHNSVRVPVTSTTGESSAMVPPASIFSQPNELSTSETDEDEAVASSIASSNDTLSTPPPSRKKKPKPKKSRHPAYDAAPMTPGQAYPSSPLMRANTLASPGPSATSASQGRRGPAGMTPASRNRNLNN